MSVEGAEGTAIKREEVMVKRIPPEFKPWAELFKKVGWFMPTYIPMGALNAQLVKIKNAQGDYSDDDLERDLRSYYPPSVLAEMLVSFYSKTPFVRDYRKLIGQALESYFLGNHHIAFSGLVGVVEGVVRSLEGSYDREGYFKKVLELRISDAITYVRENKVGSLKEIESVLWSFYDYISNSLYVDSSKYFFSDGANRNGVLHGAFTDDMHGRPLGFLKLVSCLDALTFIISITGRTDESSGNIAIWRRGANSDSQELERYYWFLIGVSGLRENLSFFKEGRSGW